MLDRPNKPNEEQQNSESSLLLRVGAVAVGGALGAKYIRRRGGSSTFSDMLRSVADFEQATRPVRNFLGALDYALDQRGILHHLARPKRLENRFNQYISQSLKFEERRNQTLLGGMATQIERRTHDFLNAARKVKKETFYQYRWDKLIEDLYQRVPDRMENGLHQALNAVRDELFYDKPSFWKIKGLLDRFSPEEAQKKGHAFSLEFKNEAAKEEFAKFLYGVFKKYESVDSEGIITKELKELTRKNLQHLYEGVIRDHEQRENFWRSLVSLGGWRPATVKEVLEHMDADSIQRPFKYGGHRDFNIVRFIREAAEKDSRFGDLVADPALLINSQGEFLDLRTTANLIDRTLHQFRETTQVPILRFNPLDLFMYSTWRGVLDAPAMYILRRGTIHPYLKDAKTLPHPMAHNQDAVVGPLSRSYMYTGGQVIDLGTGEVIQHNVYLANTRFGTIPRMIAGMANLHRRDLRNRGFLANLFDLFGQENESALARFASVITKYDDPSWEPNTLKAVMEGKLNLEEAEFAYKNLYQKLAEKVTPLSDDVAEYLNRHVTQAYGDIGIDLTKLNTPEEIMDSLGKIYKAWNQRSRDLVPIVNETSDEIEGLYRQIQQTWKQYYRNPSGFLKSKRLRTDDVFSMLEGSIDFQETELLEQIHDVKRLIHQHALKQLDYHLFQSGEGKTVYDLIEQGIKRGVLDRDAVNQVKSLEVLTTMRKWWHDVYMDPRYKPEALAEFIYRVKKEGDPFSEDLQQVIAEHAPWWGLGPGQPPPNYQGFTEFTVMNKMRGYRWALENYNRLVSEGMSPLKAGIQSALDVLAQPFAGRHNLDKVTTITLPFYIFAERLDNLAAQAGLGLSQKNRGSMLSILGNQFLRRIVLPYAAYEQLKYFDGLFGDAFSDELADTYVNMHLDVARAKEFLGINRIGRQLAQLFPGADQIAEIPPVKLFNFLTFGLFSDWRSEEELRKYYESGEDPIRKGRYWGLGSDTPWSGGKIDRFEPNWYRKLKSDYEFTETMYGSEEEYWENHWMPTLTNPLAPLRHFLLDPYHWEKKHYHDRPYPLMGGFAELEQIPLIGSLLNNTIGQILKPYREREDLEKHHRKYIEAMNQYLTSRYLEAAYGIDAQGLPAGGIKLVEDEDGASAGEGESTSEESGDVAIVSEGGEGQGSGGAKIAVRQQLTDINQSYVDGTDRITVPLDTLQALHDPYFIEELSGVGRIDTLSQAGRSSFYSLTEIGGIYGFLAKDILDWNEFQREPILEPSTRITSYARKWWDLELGGLGGDLSELFRRYVPRDPNKNYYNPIRNTMPDWLPGFDYYINFQYGDPYSRIPHGEIRLPGAAYESLYKLHPDALGRYGAFDRFRILADVAPYSEEYRMYRKLVSMMKREGLLTKEMEEEYSEIINQVQQKKQKYRLYPRRFGNADLIFEDVTITKVIDANTFLTEEYPNIPIKLAGIHIKADDKEAIEFLRQFIYEGARVRIGMNADPLFRIKNDKIPAVVYAGDDGQFPLFSMQGQNLNYLIANKQFGGFMGFGGTNKVSVKDDGSPAATVAIFGDQTAKVGEFIEFVTHDLLPNIPIVGPLIEKFVQVRSPLEMYKKVEVYGKAWRPWEEWADSFLTPLGESLAAKNPILAAAQGYGIGWLFGKNKVGKYYWKYAGAIIGGALSTLRVFREQLNELRADGDEYNDTWIPLRRKLEREINEYFDKIKYIKYKALFELANEEAKKREGFDVKQYLERNRQRGRRNKQRKRELEIQKKWLNIQKKIGYGDEELVDEKLSRVRDRIKDIDEDRPEAELGPYSLMALRYYEEYTSTLYGADPHGDIRKIFKALPSKDREFFPKFLEASPEEREEILRLVPKDQRRFYQAIWGLKVDEKESLESFFRSHYLPDPKWEGWRPDVSLDDIKIKVVQNEGLDLTEFGYWEDDKKLAEMSKAKPINIREKGLTSRVDIGRIEEALKNAGLQDVRVAMSSSYGKDENKVNVLFNLVKDRSKEILKEINMNLDLIFG